MKKTMIVIILAITVCFVIRLLCCFTLLDMPHIFGTNTYVGESKYDFPKCILNPLKTKAIEEEIHRYVQQKTVIEKELGNQGSPDNEKTDYEVKYNKKFRWWFYGRLNKIPEFKVVSVNTDYNDEYGFLLQAKDNPEIQCVAFMDKETKQKIRIVF